MMDTQNSVKVVRAGKQFSIDLDAVPGAGYMWEMARTSATLELLEQKIVSISKEIGGKSTQRFLLIAHQPGDYSLVFELKRRWEKKPVRTSKIFIKAQ